MIKGTKVLVTGGAGFVGSHLVKRLLQHEAQVTVIDDLSEGKWSNLPQAKNLIKHKASILGNLDKYVAGQEIIFHLAAIPWPKKSIEDPVLTQQVNVDGTLNLLLAAKKYAVKKFVFSSSYAVYGNQNRSRLSEDLPPHPQTPYALQKLTGEYYCQLFSSLWGVETVCLRYFSIYGAGMRFDGPYATLIPRFIKMLTNNQVPTINGSGEQTRDFIHVSDVVEANILAAQSNLSGAVLNIGSGQPLSLNTAVDLLNKYLGKQIKPLHGPAVIEPALALGSFSKAKKLLHWHAKIKFADGIKSLLA